ncbi:hypothetical protein LZ30DRAFT_595962 [Colletotrichum cereale]|nr:hypothetical protein LZ30DRAFT_595962 [Colletotrichum cereale]
MPPDSRLDRLYARLLADHPYGWALFKKVTTNEIRPGTCGYFDSESDWRTLVDLTSDPEELARDRWKPPSIDLRDKNAAPEHLLWGPKHSNSVNSRRIGGSIGANCTVAAPVEASATVIFESGSDESAVLATESPVHRYRLGDESIALQWMEDNTSEMLRRHKGPIKKHGVWIVTKTYSTRQCAVAIMTSKSSAVEISLTANARGLLTLGPTSSWSKSRGSSCVEIHEGRDDNEEVIVFISGIYFSRKLLSSTLKHVRDQVKQEGRFLRGAFEDRPGSHETLAKEDDETDIELEAEYFPPLSVD